MNERLISAGKKEGIDDETIINILAMVLGAASDTTSSVLQLFFKVMALHPDAIAIAQAGLCCAGR